MENNYLNLKNVVDEQQRLLEKEKELYLSSAKNINMRYQELLKANLGSTLVEMCAEDISGEIVRRYFDTSDYNITVDQMFNRIVHFSYEKNDDIFNNNNSIKKEFYNISDSENSTRIKDISNENQKNQKQLFDNNRSQDSLDRKGKKDYRESMKEREGKIIDELTGRDETKKIIIKNGKEVEVSDLHADHIQARESITFNEKYLNEAGKETMKKFYNSADNMQMIHASANTSKKDVRVCMIDGNLEYIQSNEMESRISKGEKIQDITSTATADQLTNATVEQWEKETSRGKIEKLKEKGYLDENGNVKKEVKEDLKEKIRKSQQQESIELLKNLDYKEVSKDAFGRTIKSVDKILIGQVIYYTLPPLVFETQQILKKDNMDIEIFWKEFKGRSKRIIEYIESNLKKIVKNIFDYSVSTFLKIFFDILVGIVKDTIKRFMKVIKNVVMSLVKCMKIICNKKASARERADAVAKTLAVALSGIILEVLFEYLEKQFKIPGIIAEPLQIIVTVLVTNLIMLVLEKADLFNVKHGLLVSNMEKAFVEENQNYIQKSNEVFTEGSEKIAFYMDIVSGELSSIKANIMNLNMYEDDMSQDLEKINQIFNMDINFENEWNIFVGKI